VFITLTIRSIIYVMIDMSLFCPIMKRKFKQWWSTIPPISTKQATSESKKDHNLWHCLINTF